MFIMKDVIGLRRTFYVGLGLILCLPLLSACAPHHELKSNCHVAAKTATDCTFSPINGGTT